MYKKVAAFYFRTISSLHCGSGNDLGIVDLPIQREKHTSFPKVESSSLKGALREAFETKIQTDKENFVSGAGVSSIQFEKIEESKNKLMNFDFALHLAFGYDDANVDDSIKNKFQDDTEFSGALAFSDARLIFFPVKSVKGVFAWVTCPYVIKRFVEDMQLCGINNITFENIDVNIGECKLLKENKVSINNNVILEEYTFNVKQEIELKEEILKLFPTLTDLKQRLVILNDDDFKDFVNLSTEVITRTKIDNATGTVATGALFNEEFLPPETIMYYMVFASPVFQKDDNKKGIFKQNGKNEEDLVMDFFVKSLPEVMQLGGNATIGKGIIKTKKMGGN